MTKIYPYRERLRYELFDKLLPMMLYQGTDKEREAFFTTLHDDGQSLIYAMLQDMCRHDKIECPYALEDFGVNITSYENIGFIQINLPACNDKCNATLRAYLLFPQKADAAHNCLYFIIKRFQDGSVYILHINRECNALIIEKLTGNCHGINYEHSRLMEACAAILLNTKIAVGNFT